MNDRLKALMKARKEGFLRENPAITPGQLIGNILRTSGFLLGVAGFCILGLQLVASFETTYWSDISMDVLLAPFRLSINPTDSPRLFSFVHVLKTVPLGIGLIGCGMPCIVIGNIILDLAKGRSYARLLRR